MAEQRDRTTLSLSGKLYRELKELADKDCRSLTGTIELLLKSYKQKVE